MVRTVIWPNIVQKQLEKVYLFISQDSMANAQRVKSEIFAATTALIANPEKYPPDKYRLRNDGTVRAFELYHYRISYKITEKHIIIVRLRHTKMQPKSY